MSHVRCFYFLSPRQFSLSGRTKSATLCLPLGWCQFHFRLHLPVSPHFRQLRCSATLTVSKVTTAKTNRHLALGPMQSGCMQHAACNVQWEKGRLACDAFFGSVVQVIINVACDSGPSFVLHKPQEFHFFHVVFFSFMPNLSLPGN